MEKTQLTNQKINKKENDTTSQSNDIFKDIYGYQDIKDELLAIKSHYEDEELLQNKDITLPRGILLHGDPGCGKTMFVKAFANSFDCPKYFIDGSVKHKNLVQEIKEVFEKARQDKFSLVIIDELDLLLQDKKDVIRQLQMDMDGFNDNSRVLVIATAQSYQEIPDPLLRRGRFGRRIDIYRPSERNMNYLYSNFLSKYKFTLDKYDLVRLCKITPYCNCADIKTIVDEAYVYSKGHLSFDELEQSMNRVLSNGYSFKPYKGTLSWVSCIHEAGHIVMTKRFKDTFQFYSVYFKSITKAVTVSYRLSEKDFYKNKMKNQDFQDDERAYGDNLVDACQGHDIYDDENPDDADYFVRDHIMPIEFKYDDIKIAMAGYLAEQIFFKTKDIGSEGDIYMMREAVHDLVTCSGVAGIKNFAITTREDPLIYGNKPLENLNRAINKLYKKLENEARRYLKHHKEDILKVATQIQKEKVVTYKTICI